MFYPPVYYDAYYNKAQKVRGLIKRDFQNAYQEVDAILSPVTPNVAPTIGADKDNPLQQYLADIFHHFCKSRRNLWHQRAMRTGYIRVW